MWVCISRDNCVHDSNEGYTCRRRQSLPSIAANLFERNFMKMTNLITLQEAKNTLRISVATLRRLIAKQVLGYYRIGLRIMFSDTHISDYLSSVERKRLPSIPGKKGPAK